MAEQKWTTVIKPKTNLFDLRLRELWKYRDLIKMFVVKTYTVQYKQTILGPLWYIISPLLTSGVFTIIFGRIANITTDGAPQFVFFMSGTIIWSYFAACLDQTSKTFASNANLFGKIYFPRLATPISVVLTSLINFGVQLLVFVALVAYYAISVPGTLAPNLWILAVPVLLLQCALLGLGFGIIISSLTTKYRDLAVLTGFGIQLWMYITPVVYPASMLSERFRGLIMYNPVTPIVEIFRHAFLGTGKIPYMAWGISWLVTFAVVCFGIVLFNRVEKTFMDTV